MKEKKPAVISFMGRFPDQAIQLKPTLVAAANGGEPLLRFQATLALLRIDPHAAEVMPALRRELVGRFGAQLLSEKLPQAVTEILKQILDSPTSFVETQAAKRLLKKLVSGTDGH